MRKAFHPEKGTLTNLSDPYSEREYLSHLFAGAIGSYKNSHLHRTVNLTGVREAQEQVVLASNTNAEHPVSGPGVNSSGGSPWRFSRFACRTPLI
jgi:Protein of unknown function (Hypoth_ymh)